VKPGERVPINGVVIRGKACIDESLLTGESKPVPKEPGSEVIGGSLNIDGALVIEVRRTSKETFLQQVIRLVKQAQGSKTEIQTLADKGAMVPTYAAVVIAIVAMLYWLNYDVRFAVERVIAVLVAACPHALGIGAPLSAIVTLMRSARRGILIRNRRAFENAVKTDVVLFDKTGTLTKGELRVASVRVLSDAYSEEEVLKLAASVETVSEHPIAKAIIDYAAGKGVKLVEIEDFESVTGVGIKGVVEGHEVYVGGPALLKELGLAAPSGVQLAIVVYVVVDGKLVGEITLTDTVREESFEAVRRLREMGIN